jgi:hypothetical protein
MGAEVISMDMRQCSPEADCLDCLVALPSTIERMRETADDQELPTRIIRATRLAFEALDSAQGKGILMVAASSQDLLYRNVVGLTTMDQYTRVYFGRGVRDLFMQLSKRQVRTYYVLDNALRNDRYEAVLELFDLAGILTVSPRRDGNKWPKLAGRIHEIFRIAGHVAYIEPDAEVCCGPLSRREFMIRVLRFHCPIQGGIVVARTVRAGLRSGLWNGLGSVGRRPRRTTLPRRTVCRCFV